MIKKLLFVVILMCVGIASFSINAHANEYGTDSENVELSRNDSVVIDDDEYKLFECSESETLIRVYNGFYMIGFANHETIDELIGDQYTLNEIYGVIKEESSCIDFNMTLVDGKPTRLMNTLQASAIIPDRILSYQNVFSASKMGFSMGELVVDKIYCLDGTSSANGLYIYYVTNKGDFVYFKQDVGVKEEYLLPLNTFYEFAEMVQQEIMNNSNLNGMGVASLNLHDIFDITDYLLEGTGGVRNKDVSKTSDSSEKALPFEEDEKILVNDTTKNKNSYDNTLVISICSVVLINVIGIMIFLIVKRRRML